VLQLLRGELNDLGGLHPVEEVHAEVDGGQSLGVHVGGPHDGRQGSQQQGEDEAVVNGQRHSAAGQGRRLSRRRCTVQTDSRIFSDGQ
jgi:hypothetical protein